MRRSATPPPPAAARRPAGASLPAKPPAAGTTRPATSAARRSATGPVRETNSKAAAGPSCPKTSADKPPCRTGVADRKPAAGARPSAPSPPSRAAAVKAAGAPVAAAAAAVGVAPKGPMPSPPRKRSRVQTPSPVPQVVTSTPSSSSARERKRVIASLTRGGVQPVRSKPAGGSQDTAKKQKQQPAPRRHQLVPASPAVPVRNLRPRDLPPNTRKKPPVPTAASSRSNLRGRAPTPRHAASSAGGGAGGGAGPKGGAAAEPSGPSMVDVEGGSLALQQQQQQQQQLQQQQQQLAAQYQQVVSEKARLEARLAVLLDAEHEVHSLRERLQEQHSTMEQLRAENVSLQAKLLSVAHSPLSDSEKQQLLLGARQHSSAPASMVASDLQLPVEDTADATIPETSIPSWDRQSASSASQLSVACLQDRIQQMEETHYSTNEELQATLQELSDLQSQLQELQAENERLVEDKHILVEYLCQQSEKLEDSRSQAEALQGMLLRGGPGEVVHDDRLLDLLKIAQEKRDCLLVKQQELTTQVAELRQATNVAQEEAAQSRESARKLEATLEAVQAERHTLERELAEVRQESSSRLIELQRLTTLLENARAKIEELETARELEDKSDVEEMLDNVRKEKDTLESQVATMQEQVLRGQCEITRLEEQLMHLQEECKVTRNNAKSALSDLEYKFESLKQEKQQLSTEVQVLQKSLSDIKMQCQCYLDDKEQLQAVLADCQKHLSEAEQKLAEQEKSLEEERRLRQQESEEWQQFQTDLLTTVRVANDFKTEASEELKKLLVENKNLRDKVRNIEAQLEKYKATPKPPTSATLGIRVPTSAMQETGCPTSTVTNSVPQEITLRGREIGVSRQDSQISVKSLIESIENATKQAKGPRSRSSSTSSLSSITSEVRTATSTGNPSMPQTPNFTRRHNSETDAVFSVKTPLRDQQQSNNQTVGNNTNNMKASQNRRNLITDNTNSKANLYNDSLKNNKPLGDVVQANPVSILANKTMDFVRKNSCSDLSERKDPLSALTKNGGSKRNALLKWCQNKTVGYKNIDITNFSSSWNDGLAFCAILHSYLPDKVPYDTLNPSEKRRNFCIAFAAAESVGIPTTLNLSEMIQLERPDWQQIMAYVTAIYKHFET
ncbi:cytospin-A isoform X4 [Schistocerca gregaria]|uniref:cytospin-A isoform X4 n=1 Tax=Schistocerca gregaria TaxID=7010 RepID=UPI00211DC80B|nr:cytospin-A isoform X4 [Schistocerca gregaria]